MLHDNEKFYSVRTLGCKANLSESLELEKQLQSQGWQPWVKGQGHDPSCVQLCIVNSCTVTNEADRQSQKMATRIAREHPHAKVVMTGCGAEVDPDTMAQVPGVDYVVGNQNKNQLIELVSRQSFYENISSHILSDSISPRKQGQKLGKVQNYQEMRSVHPTDREWPSVQSNFDQMILENESSAILTKTRSFLKIQEGCDAFCTYCIIPYGRGPSRSLTIKSIVQQIQILVSQGTREVILTGTNIGDYQDEGYGASSLEVLIQKILEQTTLERLRLSSLDPTEITDGILSLFQKNTCGRLCPHFHVSLQSPHSKILRLMKRKYRFEEVERCLARIHEISEQSFKHLPGGIFVGMDLITGFPGENEEDFNWTYEVLKKLPWTRLHVFPYSERKGTPATRLSERVAPHVRSNRAKKLLQLSLERMSQIYHSVLQDCTQEHRPLQSILLEKNPNSDWYCGYTSNYQRVMIQLKENLSYQPNQIVSAIPFEVTQDSAAGEVAFLAR